MVFGNAAGPPLASVLVSRPLPRPSSPWQARQYRSYSGLPASGEIVAISLWKMPESVRTYGFGTLPSPITLAGVGLPSMNDSLTKRTSVQRSCSGRNSPHAGIAELRMPNVMRESKEPSGLSEPRPDLISVRSLRRSFGLGFRYDPAWPLPAPVSP